VCIPKLSLFFPGCSTCEVRLLPRTRRSHAETLKSWTMRLPPFPNRPCHAIRPRTMLGFWKSPKRLRFQYTADHSYFLYKTKRNTHIIGKGPRRDSRIFYILRVHSISNLYYYHVVYYQLHTQDVGGLTCGAEEIHEGRESIDSNIFAFVSILLVRYVYDSEGWGHVT
jgi:hypothetical protein